MSNPAIGFDRYKVSLTLLRPMLATNPCDPFVMDTHIIGKQRKMILDKNKTNVVINKYLDALPLTAKKGQDEVKKIIEKLQELSGIQLDDSDWVKVSAGDLSALKETFSSVESTGTTIFFWDQATDHPCIGDHMILGFLKAAAEAIYRTKSPADRPKKVKGKKDDEPVLDASTVAPSAVFTVASTTASLLNQHVGIEERFITFDKDIIRDDDGVPVYLQRSLRAMTMQGPRISLAKSEQVDAGAKLNFTLFVMAGSPIKEDHLHMMFSYGVKTGLGQWRNAGWGRFTYELQKI